jgi:oligopeptide transport system substrate-binding protein
MNLRPAHAGTARRWAVMALAALVAATAGCRRREPAAERGVRERVLHQSVGAQHIGLDPHLATTLAEGMVLRAVFEGLVAADARTLEPCPAAARAWTVSPDGLVYTFHLREDARWSNGDPVTAADFAGSFRRALTPELAAPNAYLMHVLAGARDFNTGATRDFGRVGVEALDPHTLRLTLARPSPAFLSILGHFVWLPVHLPTVRAAGSETARHSRWTRPETFVGNGPFRPVDQVPDQFLRVTANPFYHGAAALHLAGIVFHTLGVAAEEPAFRTGQIHVGESLPIAKVPGYRRNHPAALRVAPSFGTYFYRINVTRPPLDDARVRRALSAALDRRLLTETVLDGVYAPAHAFTPPGPAGYRPPPGAVDDAGAARRLLAEAGFPGGAGLRKIEILFNTSESHRLIAEAVQQIWRESLGITPLLANQEEGVFRDTCRQLRYDVSRASWFGDYPDPASFLEIFTTGNPNNRTGWSNADYDSLIAEASSIAGPARRLETLRRAEALLLAEMPVIPVFIYSTVRLVDPRLQGWFDNPLDQHPCQIMSFAEPASAAPDA